MARPFARTAALLLAAAALGAAANLLLILLAPPPPPPAPAQLQAALPGASAFEPGKGPTPHWIGRTPSGGVAGVVVLTDRVPPRVRGYGGEMAWAVGVTAEGKVAGFALLRHRETPFYLALARAGGSPGALSGADLSRPLPVSPEADAVSGATVTSRAILADASAAARAAAVLQGISVPPPPPAPSSWLTPRTGAALAALLLGAAAALFPSRALGALSLAGGLLVLGVWLNAPFTLSHAAALLEGRLPLGEPVLLLVLLFLLLSLPLLGRAWCRFLCPFGALQQLLHLLSPVKDALAPAPGSRLAEALPSLRRILLALLLLLALPLGLAGMAETEPFFALFSGRLTALGWMAAGLVVMVSLGWRRFWCSALCPSGTLLALVCRAFPWRGRRDETV